MMTVTEYDQCIYTHDISDEGRDVKIFEHLDGDEWSCQHPAADESEYCPFHQPVEGKDDQAVVRRFREVVNSGYDDVDLPPQERFRLLGAEFGDFSLPLFTTLATSGQLDPAAAEYPLDLRDIHVEGALHWSNSTVHHDLLLDGASVVGEVNFSETTIDGYCSFSNCDFGSLIRLTAATIQGRFHFEYVECDVAISLRACEIDGRVRFTKTHIGGATGNDCTLDDILINPGDVICEGTEFHHHVHFEDVVLEGVADFRAAAVSGGVHFEGAEVHGTKDLDGVSGSALFCFVDIELKSDFSKTTLAGRVTFRKATIGDSVSFKDARIGGPVNLIKARTGGFVSFYDSNAKGKIRLKNATIGGNVNLHHIRSEGTVELSDAEIDGDADFREGTIDGWVKTRRATIDGDVKFGNAAISRGMFEGMQISGDAHIDGPFDAPPSLKNITVDGTLVLGFTVPDSDQPVIKLQEATLGAIRPSKNTLNQVLRLDGATIGRLTTSEVPHDMFLTRWSLRRMRFEEFDFIASRGLLKKRGWNLHELDSDARTALAHVEATKQAREDAHSLVMMFFSSPAVAERIADDEIDLGAPDDILTSVADTVDAEQSITFRRDSDQDFLNAIATERVLSILETSAENFVSVTASDELVTPTPESDQLLKDDLQAALADVYADPERFRARNEPAVWEATYLNAKQEANDQGLDNIAAEFFLYEKRFKRKRHAQRVRDGESLFERGKAVFDWVSNLTMDVTTGYGERPRNVIVSSLMVVGMFTGVYKTLGALSAGSGLAEYLLFSLQNFVTFIIGTRPQGTLAVRYASAMEAFLGAFFVALFVFTLTRSLNR